MTMELKSATEIISKLASHKNEKNKFHARVEHLYFFLDPKNDTQVNIYKLMSDDSSGFVGIMTDDRFIRKSKSVVDNADMVVINRLLGK